MQESISLFRIKELSDLTGMPPSNLNRYFRGRPEQEVRKSNNKVTGVFPGAVERILRSKGFDDIYRPGAYLANSQTGGVAKTTTTLTMALAFSRLSDRDTYPILLIDADSQASLTLQALGAIDEDRHVLVDYVQGKVKEIEKIVVPIGHNVFLMPSSLDNSYLEKGVSSPKDVKRIGHKILMDAFEAFSIDGRLKIFIDAPPALSPVTHTFMVGMNQLDEKYDKSLLIPIRPDKTAIKGCSICLTEYEALLSTFNIESHMHIVPFVSFYERRTKNCAEALKQLAEDEVIKKYMVSPVVIRESSEISKAINNSKNVFSNDAGKPTPVAQDYVDLMLYAMGWNK